MLNSKPYIDLEPNSENRAVPGHNHILPNLMITNFSTVKLFLCESYCTVESQNGPIRHGKKWGCRVRFGIDFGNIDYTPTFIWNGKEWLLNTWGTFIFDEIEMNPKQRPSECN